MWTVRIRPAVLDMFGWVAHTAPRRAGYHLNRLARAGWRYVTRQAHRDAWAGLRWLVPRVAGYVIATGDYAGVVEEAAHAGHALTAARFRKQRRRTVLRRLAVALVLVSLVAVLLAGWAQQHGVRVWMWAALTSVAVCAVIGRMTRRREERSPAHVQRAEGLPFPIADAHTRAEAADAVHRAITAEGITLRGTEDVRREPWGWHVAAILAKGTPADLVAKLADLETMLDLPAGGLLATPDHRRRARVALRLALVDPFRGLPPAPQYPPGSLSIMDQLVIARRMDGEDLAVHLAGVHTVVIGSFGAGKSVVLRTLADALTACHDALVWDLDPVGAGLDTLGGAIARHARDPHTIERALAEALAYAHARPALLDGLGMGDAWQPSRERPALVLVIDEYPALTDRAKSLAVALLRAGRKARISLILASSAATTDALGAAIADTTECRVMLASRHTDIRLTLGVQRISDGWRPDRLAIPEDAGKAYIYAAGSREPLVAKIRPVDRARAARDGAARAAHGLPTMDPDTVRAAAHLTGTTAPAEPVSVPVIDGRAVVDVLAVFDQMPKLFTSDILARLSIVDVRYTEWTPDTLAATLKPLGVAPGQVKIFGTNRNGYSRDQIERAWRAYRAGARP